MRRYIIIVLVVLLLLLLIVTGVVYFLKGKTQPTTQTTPPGLPIASSTSSVSTSSGTNTYSLPGQNGAIIATKDFIHNGQTVEDEENPGNYYLAGSLGYCNPDGTCPSGAPSKEYNVVYYSASNAFIVSLNSEPLSQARTDAQNFMLQTLGISQQQMCNLNYQVLTTIDVNGQYAGQNLGFSFCPGATQLPG